MNWGLHLLINCKACDLTLINDKDHILAFNNTIIERIGMTAHGQPQLEFLLPGEDNEGYSLLQMITTSNITAHFVSRTGDAYIDVFSCKDFDVRVAIQTVVEYFKPESYKPTIIGRRA
jgi:S-adenosylmethionine/arginine decarboxylase-like enzyme